MPIVRSYMCEDCGHALEVTLRAGEWNAEAPECPACAAGSMGQTFKAPGIIGSARSRAVAVAERIAAEDYGVANMHVEGKEGVRNKVTYKDQPQQDRSSFISPNREMLETVAAIGRETRIKYGNGLDVLQENLKSGAQPDLIKLSKQRSMRIY